MQAVLDAIERFPVATITHVLVAVILGVDLLVQGGLSQDALTYAGIVEGGNIGVAGSRAHVAGKKVDAAANANPPLYATAGNATAAYVNWAASTPAGPDFDVTPVAEAPDEPGDEDALPHISTRTDPIPADQGDAGGSA